MPETWNTPGHLHETGGVGPTEPFETCGPTNRFQSTGGDADANPFDNPVARANAEEGRARREQAEADAEVKQKRKDHWGSYRYDVAILGTLPAAWAAKRAATIERKNAGRDPVRAAPVLVFSGGDAVEDGATDEQLAALPPLRTAELAALRKRAAAEMEAARIEARADGQQIKAERDAEGLELPEFINLETFVPSSDPWLVEGLWRQDMNIGLFAERKAGKTTAVIDLVRGILTGSDVFGRFPVTVPEGTEVVLFDTEMPVELLYDDYTKAKVGNLSRLRLASLRGRESTFDVRVPALRAQWAARITPGSVLVFDCLYSILAALGISENDDGVAAVMLGLRALATEAKALGTALVHHLGKDADRGARGHSSIEGFADVLCHIGLDGPLAPETARLFRAYGRGGVNIQTGHLRLGDDYRLTYVPVEQIKAEKQATKLAGDDALVLAAVKEHEGLSGSALHDLPIPLPGDEGKNLTAARITAALKRLEDQKIVVNRTGNKYAPEWVAVPETEGTNLFASVSDLVADRVLRD